MKTKGKDRMTEFNLKLELKTFKNKTGDDFLFVKTDGSYFAFKKVVAKQAIGRGLGMGQDKNQKPYHATNWRSFLEWR